MKKYWFLFKEKASNCLIHSANYISKHCVCLFLWTLSLCVAVSLFLLQKIDYVTDTMQMKQENTILVHEQEIIFDSFMNQTKVITEQSDMINKMKNKILEAQEIMRLQDGAIKSLIKELIKAGGSLPQKAPQKNGDWI